MFFCFFRQYCICKLGVPLEECILFVELWRSCSLTFSCLLDPFPSFSWTTGNCRLLGKISYVRKTTCFTPKKLLFTFTPFPPFPFEVVSCGILEGPSSGSGIWLGVFWNKGSLQIGSLEKFGILSQPFFEIHNFFQPGFGHYPGPCQPLLQGL